MDITQDPKIQYFFMERELRPNTIKRYTKDITRYCEFLDKTPTELINEARKEQKQYEYDDEKHLTVYLSTYREHLKSKGYQKYSIKISLIIIKTFYHQFSVTTPDVTIKGEPSTYYITNDELPTHDDIRLIINISHIKYKAIFTHLASSGMNISDALSLQVKDLIRAVQFNHKKVETIEDIRELLENNETLIPVWKVARTKGERPRVTFTSPESLKYTLDYFTYDPPEDETDYLFRGRKGKNVPYTYQAVSRYLRNMNKKVGWGDKRLGTFYFITTKSLRTYFANTLEEYGVQEKFIRSLMGHVQVGIRQSYHKLNIPLLQGEYSQALPGLTFLGQVDLVDTSDAQNKKIEEQDKTIEWLKQEIIEMKRQNQQDKTLKKEKNK